MAASSTSTRPYDILVWGATGFTGALVCEYLASSAPPNVTWAIGGRSLAKLEEVRNRLPSKFQTLPIVIGDSGNQQSIDAAMAQAKVVICTTGPFMLYALPVVAACARLGTHYVDITGEANFIRECIDRYDAQARASGALIISGCGWDSIPSDLGTLLVVDYMKNVLKLPVRSVRGYIWQMKGGASGGTLQTAKTTMDLPVAELKRISDPYLLVPAGSAPQRQLGAAREGKLPAFDPAIKHWTLPFILSGANMRVVRRSAALLQYGENFTYTERFRARGMVVAWLTFLVTTIGLLLIYFRVTRAVLDRFLLPQPGQGPSAQDRKSAKFEMRFYADSEAVRGAAMSTVAGGDAGYTETSKMVSEAALLILLQRSDLPAQGGGVLTPAAALGLPLLARLRAAGMRFDLTKL